MRRQELGIAAWHRIMRVMTVLAIAHAGVAIDIKVHGAVTATRRFDVPPLSLSIDIGLLEICLNVDDVQKTCVETKLSQLACYWTENDTRNTAQKLVILCNGCIVAGHSFDEASYSMEWQNLHQRIVSLFILPSPLPVC